MMFIRKLEGPNNASIDETIQNNSASGITSWLLSGRSEMPTVTFTIEPCSDFEKLEEILHYLTPYLQFICKPFFGIDLTLQLMKLGKFVTPMSSIELLSQYGRE